jgi:hypothetical protein
MLNHTHVDRRIVIQEEPVAELIVGSGAGLDA